MQDLSTERESGSTDADPTPVRRLSYSKSEPSTPNHLTVKYTTAEGLEKRRSRRSRRRRALPPRSRKSKERAVAHLVERQGNRDSNEPSDELEKRIERLDLDLNLALRREPPHDTNKGVKYLQRFLFKKRRRHSDGYGPLLSLSSPLPVSVMAPTESMIVQILGHHQGGGHTSIFKGQGRRGGRRAIIHQPTLFCGGGRGRRARFPS